MANIAIIGSGQLGSRHLQSLKLVKHKLNIFVIDPSSESLKIAKERYNSFEKELNHHSIYFSQDVKEIKVTIEIAIIATNSNTRRNSIEALLNYVDVKFFILEKILFDNEIDYSSVQELLIKRGSKAWVNCSMRTIPFYKNLKEQFSNSSIHYRVIGSQYGLVTSLIHYLDHIAYLTSCSDFTLDTTLLSCAPIKSRRAGFLELSGTCIAHFSNGSIGYFSCYKDGNLPFIVEIASEKYFYLSKEFQGKAYLISGTDSIPVSQEIDAPIPFQSQMTHQLVDEILESGKCSLVSYAESAKIHLTMLNALSKFLIKSDINFNADYPFT